MCPTRVHTHVTIRTREGLRLTRQQGHVAYRHACGALQGRDLAWLRPSGRVGAVAKELQGFGAPALLLDTLELAAGLLPHGRDISASVDGAR